MSNSEIRLSQRGRAGMQFLGHLRGISSSHLRDLARDAFDNDPASAPLKQAARQLAPEDTQGWMRVVRDASKIAKRSDAHRFERFYQYIGGHEIFVRGICATEECRDEIERVRDRHDGVDDDGTTLELADEIEAPRYVSEVEFHTQPGGWDGYDLYGEMFQYAFGPHVFRYGGYAVVESGQQTRFSRQDPWRQLPKGSYERIYEVGCGTGGALFAARELFPDAELVGSDVSAVQLRHGARLSRQQRAGITFKQRLATATGEPDESFDAAMSFAFFHELPRAETIRVLGEMYRILRPGGSFVIVDPPPFHAVDLFQSVIMDWESLHHGEPYFSISCASHWAAEMEKIGFVNVQEKALHERNGYPYVTVGTKPVATS